MADRADHRAEFIRAARAKTRCARCSRSATRSSRSSRSRARRRAPSTRCAANSPASSTRRRRAGDTSVSPLVPLGRKRAGSVDRVFGTQEVDASVTTDEVGIPEHQPLPDAAPGLVELWPLIAPAERQRDRRLGRAVRHRERATARALCWRTASPDTSKAGWRAASRRRCAGAGALAHRCSRPLIRALKNADVPVAGVDRLALTEHIAVMDLMALADCAPAAGRRSHAGERAEEPAVRAERRTVVRAGFRPQGFLRASVRGNAAFAERQRLDDSTSRARAYAIRFFAHVPARSAGARRFSRALDWRRRTRSTNSSIWHLTTRRARRRRCKGSSPGCARRKRSEARHGDGARRGAGDDRARRQGAEADTVILADTTDAADRPSRPRLIAPRLC